MPVGRAGPAELERLRTLVHDWVRVAQSENPLLIAVDHDPALDRWYVRLRGEDKLVITVWMTLRERTLHFETYFMPAPEEQREACFEYLLRVNQRLFAWRFAVGEEDAVYLVGQLPLAAVDHDELDRIIGSAWAYSEQCFRPAMGIGYASRFGHERAGRP